MLSKKPPGGGGESARKEEVRAGAKLHKPSPFPSTVMPVVFIIDLSQSMDLYHEVNATLVKKAVEHIKNNGGQRALSMVYLMVVKIGADGLKTLGFQPLGEASDVEAEVNGATQIGGACNLATMGLEKLIFKDLIEAECRARGPEVVIFSEMDATGEESEETLQGIERLKAIVKKARGRITIVGPSAEEMNKEYTRALAGPEGPVKYLDADPNKLVRIVLETLS